MKPVEHMEQVIEAAQAGNPLSIAWLRQTLAGASEAAPPEALIELCQCLAGIRRRDYVLEAERN